MRGSIFPFFLKRRVEFFSDGGAKINRSFMVLKKNENDYTRARRENVISSTFKVAKNQKYSCKLQIPGISKRTRTQENHEEE